MNKKFIIIQPTHSGGVISKSSMQWTNDSFNMLSKQFQAPLHHINEENIPLDADVYIMCSFDINLIQKEIDFVKKVHEHGGKVLVGFSQDMRFLHGGGLMSNEGVLWTGLCEVADAISSGVSSDFKVYGRYQDKVIPLGEVLEDINWSVPIEQKEYDLIACEAVSEYALAFELEFLLTCKERHPDHKIACVIAGQHLATIEKLRPLYPQIEFPYDPVKMPNLLAYIKKTKVFCNPEIRPRPCRTAMESYYCRVPFIVSSLTYHSKLCHEFAYSSTSIVDMVDSYDRILESDRNEIISKMEERAKYDSFQNFHDRIIKGLGLE